MRLYPELCWVLYFKRWEKVLLNSNYIKKTCRKYKIFAVSELELPGLFSEIKKTPWKKRILYSNFISSNLYTKWNTLFFPPILDHFGFKAAGIFCFSFFVLFYLHQSHKNETFWWLFLHSENNSYFFSTLPPKETVWSGSINFHLYFKNLLQN